VAAFTFTADPAFVTAGDFDAALHAEFPGDDRYGVARTSTALLVRARGPDAARTIVEVDPSTLAANGADTATVTVKLVDGDGNLLGPDADEHDVARLPPTSACCVTRSSAARSTASTARRCRPSASPAPRRSASPSTARTPARCP